MDTQFEGFIPIHTIFYSNFHPTEGSKVCYQFPPNNLQNFNINFNSIKNYIIPKMQLCHKLLTFKYENYRIVSFPVTVSSLSYARNFFSFNFVFIFPYDCETSPYEPAIERLGKMFRVLEEQSQILSMAENDPVFFKDSTAIEQKINTDFSIQDIIMRIYQDLNNYSECLIPIDNGNTIDIKVFPLIPPPTSVHLSIEDVPVSVVNLNKIIDLNWDPTMLNILPFIDGLNSISNISRLSDSDSKLVIECIRHLIYYKCVVITDIFQYSNIYASTSLINFFLTDPKTSYDCQSYVTLPKSSNLNKLPLDNISINDDSTNILSKSHNKSNSMSSSTNLYINRMKPMSISPTRSSIVSSSTLSFYSHRKRSESSFSSDGNFFRSNDKFNYLPTRSTLFDLYRSLNHRITLEDWYHQNYETLNNNNIDVRRFIKFGIIKKIIYRVYSFPVLSQTKLNDETTDKKLQNKKDQNFLLSTSDIKFDVGDKILNSIYKKLSKVSFEKDNKGFKSKQKDENELTQFTQNEKMLLIESLDNFESMDTICVKLGKSRADIEKLLSEIGEYKIINS